MHPVRKLNILILGITTTIVFTIWVNLNSYLSQNKKIQIIVNDNKIFTVLFFIVFSVGFYNIIMNLLTYFFNNNQFIKKKILGNDYLEGYWVGYFIGKSKKTRIFYESFEQDLTSITIRGTSFNDDGSYHASWVSNNVVFDPKIGKITYYYENDAVNNSHINPGIGSFNVKRKSNKDPAYELIGYTSDLFNSNKITSIEQKILTKNDPTIQELYKRGKYIQNKYKMIQTRKY